MIFLFLSVAALCATALLGFRMHLTARPACTREEYEALAALVEKQKTRIDKLGMNSMGRGSP